MGLINHTIVLVLLFTRTLILLSILAEPTYNPTNSIEVLFPHPHQYLSLAFLSFKQSEKINHYTFHFNFSSVQYSCSGVSDSLWPHEPQCTRPPYPSPNPESTQTHVHCVGDAIQPSHPLSSPSPPALNLSQRLFKWVNSSHQVAKVLEFQLQHQSIQWTSRTNFL